ncbi:type I restriction-modification system subunit M [Arthrospira platensis]|nr:class I SAM-dependent DNA methyltransferase [Arthrospira platensis]AMW27079.1 DNA methyltransferase [Arthrospira platensis YZ]KDR58766.1 DNA methyltransferase [Arthrospira platensis str. Paraca]MBD2669962.1 SAM-dependent DNA methyltransferase [Arthrospira platensis FACHB-439]MBD2710541.1 SAM-dependent DNA methyltransferase [Arthrospira platensis FACHB-835]MDF2211457.1 class I SAM-dependent DNA methyltransferase [Arthrospira platensis NCB002]MDT9181951.1 class I SAM-dependent DNA methyltran
MLHTQNTTVDHQQLSNFIWQIADLLRGPYRPPQYERVMLPMTVLRRFDCILAPTKQDVLDKYQQCKDRFKDEALDSMLNKAAGPDFRFHNRSEFTFEKLKGDPNNIDKHLVTYINSFSKNIREIFERFEFTAEIEKMNEANILYLVVSKFCDVNLHPNQVDNIAMGSIFEDLIRRFNELANETAGDHFTPREVIRLMVDILFDPDDDILTKPVICRLLDPACGTGGMLSESQNYLRENNKEAQLWVFGQDFNPRAYAIAASDLLIKGNEQSAIQFGDSLTDDQYSGETFDYFLANPPFGVDWKKQQKDVKREHEKFGFAGRFGAGLPRVNDGSLLFLQHQISKFEPYQPDSDKKGSRLAIVFNGSPLFTGGAGSGESEIRKWIIENDWLEAIVALPEQMFYNTGIGTYIWIVTNRKQKHRQGKIQLIDARHRWQPMRRSLGDKRRYMGEEDIAIVVQEYGNFVETETSKIFKNEDFGYNRVPIERPLRLLYQMDTDRKLRFLDGVPHLLEDVQAIDKQLGREPRPDWNEFDRLMNDLLKQRSSRWKKAEQKLFRDVFTEREPEAEPVILKQRKAKDEPYARVWGWFPVAGKKIELMYEPDSKLRDFENVNLQDEVTRYFLEEVEPHVSDAWADGAKIRSAFEINFNRYFYKYTPPRPLAEIDSDIKQMEEEIIKLLREVTA